MSGNESIQQENPVTATNQAYQQFSTQEAYRRIMLQLDFYNREIFIALNEDLFKAVKRGSVTMLNKQWCTAEALIQRSRNPYLRELSINVFFNESGQSLLQYAVNNLLDAIKEQKNDDEAKQLIQNLSEVIDVLVTHQADVEQKNSPSEDGEQSTSLSIYETVCATWESYAGDFRQQSLTAVYERMANLKKDALSELPIEIAFIMLNHIAAGNEDIDKYLYHLRALSFVNKRMYYLVNNEGYWERWPSAMRRNILEKACTEGFTQLAIGLIPQTSDCVRESKYMRHTAKGKHVKIFKELLKAQALPQRSNRNELYLPYEIFMDFNQIERSKILSFLPYKNVKIFRLYFDLFSPTPKTNKLSQLISELKGKGVTILDMTMSDLRCLGVNSLCQVIKSVRDTELIMLILRNNNLFKIGLTGVDKSIVQSTDNLCREGLVKVIKACAGTGLTTLDLSHNGFSIFKIADLVKIIMSLSDTGIISVNLNNNGFHSRNLEEQMQIVRALQSTDLVYAHWSSNYFIESSDFIAGLHAQAKTDGKAVSIRCLPIGIQFSMVEQEYLGEKPSTLAQDSINILLQSLKHSVPHEKLSNNAFMYHNMTEEYALILERLFLKMLEGNNDESVSLKQASEFLTCWKDVVKDLTGRAGKHFQTKIASCEKRLLSHWENAIKNSGNQFLEVFSSVRVRGDETLANTNKAEQGNAYMENDGMTITSPTTFTFIHKN